MEGQKIIAVSVFLTCLWIAPATLFAQSPVQNDYFRDAEGNTYHQIFLDFQADEIIDMRYGNDSTYVDGKLSGDGYSVIIKNYPGNTSVKLHLIDHTGQKKEVIKSKCYIDPVLLHLL